MPLLAETVEETNPPGNPVRVRAIWLVGDFYFSHTHIFADRVFSLLLELLQVYYIMAPRTQYSKCPLQPVPSVIPIRILTRDALLLLLFRTFTMTTSYFPVLSNVSSEPPEGGAGFRN